MINILVILTKVSSKEKEIVSIKLKNIQIKIKYLMFMLLIPEETWISTNDVEYITLMIKKDNKVDFEIPKTVVFVRGSFR